MLTASTAGCHGDYGASSSRSPCDDDGGCGGVWEDGESGSSEGVTVCW